MPIFGITMHMYSEQLVNPMGSRSRSRSRSPHRSSHKHRTQSPKRSRHRTHTHSKDHRESRAAGDSERRHRSRSPLLEEKFKLKKKGTVDKKKPVPTAHKKDYTRYKADLKVAKREKIDESEENNSSDFEHSDETTEIMRVMGFAKFHSTKGEKKPNEYLRKTESEVRIVKKRRYRQYMNRRGGFNRPLDPIN